MGMKYEVDHDLLFEIVQCIVCCGLDVDEAFDYAVSVLNDGIEDAEYE